MGRSQETFNKKEVRNKKEKKRKEKEKKRLARKDNEKSGNLDDMIAYVDENGMIVETPPDPSKKRNVKLEDIEIGVPTRDNEADDDPIRKGIVSFFNDSKGFGFIKDSETKQGIFVHANNLLEEIREGNVVSFEVEMGHKGPTAVRVKIFKEKPPVKPVAPAASEVSAAPEAPETPEASAAPLTDPAPPDPATDTTPADPPVTE